MHRRNRHINAASAGAVSVLDSRFISGLSNGSGVSTWTNRNISVGNSPTQATANNQPVYTTNVQGGSPALLFNNSASSLGRWLSYPSTPVSGASAVSVIYGFRRTGVDGSTPGAILSCFGTGFYDEHEPWGDNNIYTAFASGNDYYFRYAFSISSTIPNNQNTISTIISATNDWRYITFNKNVLHTYASNIVGGGPYNNSKIGGNGGCRPNGGCGGSYFFWTGYLYSILLFNSKLSETLRKRFEHSVSFSFKIQCN